jgi:hypothetical protein
MLLNLSPCVKCGQCEKVYRVSSNESICWWFVLDEMDLVMKIDKKNFSVMLYESLLKVEPNKSIVHKLEEALENKPVLKDTLNEILHVFAPFHVRLSQISKVTADKKGNVTLAIPQHRSVTIPLSLEESKKLVDKLNQLIPSEKEKALERYVSRRRLEREAESEERDERIPFVSGISPQPAPEGVYEVEKEAEEHIEKEETEHDH